jgi:hypothetical protein
MGNRSAAGRTTETPTLLALRADLEAWEAAGVGDPISASHRGALGRYLTGLRSLAAAYDRPRAVLLVALALGPRTRGLPGAADLAPLHAAAALGWTSPNGSSTGTRAQRIGETRLSSADVVDLAVAWGCGWGRTVVPGHDWHGRWTAAVLALSAMAEGSIGQTLRWLEGAVPDAAEALRALGRAERRVRVIGYANRVAMELSLGACGCGGAGRPGTAGGPCGRADHRLAAWRPGVCRLPAFVATAVRGSARLPLHDAAFGTSMLVRLLRDDDLVGVW